MLRLCRPRRAVSTHSHPKVAAVANLIAFRLALKFQHTATRRWLHSAYALIQVQVTVSTHSHPKVAANLLNAIEGKITVSTHSHPKVAAYLI